MYYNKGPSGQGYGFSCGHVWMWELDCEEGWMLKNWCFWTVVLEKTLESPLDCKVIQPVHSEGDQHWDFFGGNDAEAETPVLWPPHAKSWLIGKQEGDDRGWDGWMASLTRWTWVWVNSGSLWWTGRQGVLQFMGLQRVGHDWATELNWTDPKPKLVFSVLHRFVVVVFCLKSIKAVCFDHLFRSSMRLFYVWNYIWFSPVTLSCISLIIRRAKRIQEG